MIIQVSSNQTRWKIDFFPKVFRFFNYFFSSTAQSATYSTSNMFKAYMVMQFLRRITLYLKHPLNVILEKFSGLGKR